MIFPAKLSNPYIFEGGLVSLLGSYVVVNLFCNYVVQIIGLVSVYFASLYKQLLYNSKITIY